MTRIASRHPREDFPPHPDDPAFREITGIMAYFPSECNSPRAAESADMQPAPPTNRRIVGKSYKTETGNTRKNKFSRNKSRTSTYPARKGGPHFISGAQSPPSFLHPSYSLLFNRVAAILYESRLPQAKQNIISRAAVSIKLYQ